MIARENSVSQQRLLFTCVLFTLFIIMEWPAHDGPEVIRIR